MKQNNDAASVTLCKCGTWFNNHASGQCKTCRHRPAPTRRTRRPRTRQPIVGSAAWAETRGDDLGDSPDY